MKYSTFLILAFLTICSCHKDSKEQVPTEAENPLFEFVSSETSGINFNNQIEENFEHFYEFFNYVYNGAGVAVGDINNDGLSDIFFVGNEVENKLYLNKGDFKFEDITAKANIDQNKGWHNGVVMVDINGDNLLDIYVCRGGFRNKKEDRENLLFINQGDLTFKEDATSFGLNDNGYSIMASFFDADNDNDLDMYLTNRPEKFFQNYTQVLQGKANEDDIYRDKLYINDNGNYKEEGLNAGIKNNYGYGLGLATSDLNSDGKIDIYVSNDYLERDYAYINKGNNTFSDELTKRFNHVPFYAMGVDIVDFNNDGFEDIIQLEMLPEDYERSKTTMASMNTKLFSDMTTNGFHYQYMHNMLHLNRGNGIYSEISAYAGVEKTDWSWACLGSDFDNDGFNDLFITNGFKRDIWDKDTNAKIGQYMRSIEASKKTTQENVAYIVSQFKENKRANYIFKNNGDLTFTKKTKEWGLDKESLSNGAALGDLDNDGDLDIIVNNIDGPAFVYKNTAEDLENNYLKIKLDGPKNNPSGLGTKITLTYNNEIQYHEFKTVRGYLSSVEPINHFGLGTTTNIDKIAIVWPDGKEQLLQHVKANQLMHINYLDAKSKITPEKISEPIFKDVTDSSFNFSFVHQENRFDDFKNQILLPHKLSQNGPCITVGDVNNDGLEDFYVGGAASQKAAIYVQDIKGEFLLLEQSAFETNAQNEDVGAVFFDADGDLDLDLYVVSGGNEFSQNSPTLQDRLYLNNGAGNFELSNNLPKLTESGSCVVPLDFDKDGDLDLFVGGRLIPNSYPSAPNSFLLENNKGVFTDVTQKIAPELSKIGMVTSATWNDIDGDSTEELIIVGEWMPITIFKKQGQEFINATASFNLTKTSGWWNKIVATDIDKDGDTDFVIGNLGLNYKFKASVEKPFTIFANDFDRNGTNDIFLTKHYKDRLVPVRGKECSSQQLPEISRKFRTYQQFAKADIDDILPDIENALKYETQIFESIILENNNGELQIKALPKEAQFSVINGIIVDDFNKDDILDILIAGNKFEVEVETTRADASIGQLFIGTGKGSFNAVSYLESGILLPYNVKGIEKINIGSKTGILSAINDDKLRLFIEQ
ncbi:VCBS repeat-containing protein [Maribacter aquivivus]|uniref:VCBS repeat-containing protein n=1 Tax=Maribacter aquivivus TaxID=228958 RepID=UPI00248FD35C|nr:VCBS repeat-containing protein [Maribacter aquivivus]